MNFFQLLLQLFGLYHPTTNTTTTKISGSTSTTTTTGTPTTNTTTTEGGKKVKKAMVFSLNDYPGTQNDLQGCNNDSLNWANLLKNKYGFDIYCRITDQDATKANITKYMTDLIINSKPGDILVITYSGHGTSVSDVNGDEIDGKDEAICLYDGFMLDDEIRVVFDKLPQGVKLTFVSDSCFSGTVTRAFLNVMNDFNYVSAPKYLPPKDTVDAFAVLGVPSKRPFAYPEEGMNHILISGTDDKSYSYDANIGGSACGAFSYYAIKVLQENDKLTYADFYKKISAYLPSQKYPQNPQLEGSEINKNSIMFE